jgi:peptide/nickel transport system ATP-binding protein
MTALLNVQDLRTYFFTDYGVVKALDGVSFSLTKGETLGIAGESGCGKSTLASSLIRMVRPPGRIVSGKVFLGDSEITSLTESQLNKMIRWKRIAMVFQGAMGSLNPVYTVGYQLMEPLVYGKDMNKESALEIARKHLDLVGLRPEIAKRYPHELSGGMQQRALIAMSLVMEPSLLIADEPTTALDVIVQAQIFNLLKDLQRQLGISLILITHDLSVIAELAQRIATMYAGKFVEVGSSDDVYSRPLHPYTQGLMASLIRLHGPVSAPKPIPGSPPDLIEPPSGCRFCPRCPKASDACKDIEPELIEVEPNHYVACHRT